VAEQTDEDRTEAPDVQPDAREDRWEWRRKVRANPRTYRFYRIGVGVLGAILIIAAPLTGWLPGPGGIPLLIAGLAVLASEFAWAHQVLHQVKTWAQDLTAWTGKQPAWLKFLGTVLLFAGVLVVIWLYLAALGVPGWLPDAWESFLQTLPLLG
jgi:putative transmembrane protein PGPGW